MLIQFIHFCDQVFLDVAVGLMHLRVIFLFIEEFLDTKLESFYPCSEKFFEEFQFFSILVKFPYQDVLR